MIAADGPSLLERGLPAADRADTQSPINATGAQRGEKTSPF
jgi:hypothetical protein